MNLKLQGESCSLCNQRNGHRTQVVSNAPASGRHIDCRSMSRCSRCATPVDPALLFVVVSAKFIASRSGRYANESARSEQLCP